MEYEITPEPTPEERAALVAALDRLTEEPAEWASAWWRAGVRENVEGGE